MLQVNTENRTLEIETKDEQLFIDGEPFSWDIQPIGGQRYHAVHQNKSFTLELVKSDGASGEFEVKVNGKNYTFTVKDAMAQLLEKLGISANASQKLNELKAPMPGMVLNILVEPGQTVEKGDALLVLEAMKMENVLKAPGSGKVAKIQVKKGDNVEKNHLLLTFE